MGRIARVDHRFQRLALVGKVSLGSFHQIGDQVIAALQLHIDLRESVLETVAQGHQAIVDRYRPYQQNHYDDRNNDDRSHGAHPGNGDALILAWRFWQVQRFLSWAGTSNELKNFDKQLDCGAMTTMNISLFE